MHQVPGTEDIGRCMHMHWHVAAALTSRLTDRQPLNLHPAHTLRRPHSRIMSR